jgi:hypothetical protein
MRSSLVALALSLIAAPAAAQGLEFACEYSRKVECTAAGCRDAEVGAAYLLVPPLDFLLDATIRATEAGELPVIRRCDGTRTCTAVPVRATLGNPFVNIVPLEGTYFLKIASSDLPDGTRATDFVEVATQSLGTVTYFGSCKGVVPGTVPIPRL